MMQYVIDLYYYCRYKPRLALILLAAALLCMLIVTTAYKNARGHGTLMLLFLGVDFIVICAMVPTLFVSGAEIMEDEYHEMNDQFEVQLADYSTQQNTEITSWLYTELAEAGLPMD